MADPKITRLEVNVTVDDDLRIDVTYAGTTGDDAAAKLDKAAVVLNRILGKA